jgi:protein-S-isoprenylcysteine O-methyltransferase Ste14
MTTADDRGRPREALNRGRIVRFLLAVPVYFALFMFLPVGTLAWARGWLFIVVFLVTLAVTGAYLWRVNPEVIVARAGLHEGTKPWDIILLWILLPAVYAIIPVAALDDGRFHWLPVPWWVCAAGYVLFFLGWTLVARAEAVNKFFEVTVRLQTDRGQTVVDTGPYAVVRHPGYVAAVLALVGTALALGSVWALVPAGVGSAALVLRTAWEDQTLQAELPGYKEYTQRVRYRLIPGLW